MGSFFWSLWKRVGGNPLEARPGSPPNQTRWEHVQTRGSVDKIHVHESSQESWAEQTESHNAEAAMCEGPLLLLDDTA